MQVVDFAGADLVPNRLMTNKDNPAYHDEDEEYLARSHEKAPKKSLAVQRQR